MMPGMHRHCNFLLWDELKKKDLKYIKIPKSIANSLGFAGCNVFRTMERNFELEIKRKYVFLKYLYKIQILIMTKTFFYYFKLNTLYVDCREKGSHLWIS